MKEGMSRPRYILADDFTGANDVGVALASSGIATHVLLSSENKQSSVIDTGVICTDSRDLDKQDAKSALQKVAQNYHLAQRQPLLIKKVDSTLRGNIGSEIDALLSSGYSLAIVAIAAPSARRKTVNGLCYVNDIPLAETEFASDPKSPIHSSRIAEIIQSQTTRVTVEYLSHEVNNVLQRQSFDHFYETGSEIIVCDTETHDDLYQLYQAATQLKIPTVFVTTGELTHAIVEQQATADLPLKTSKQPVLAMIGSMSEMTLTQSQYLVDEQVAEVIDLELDNLLSDNSGLYINKQSADAISRLKSGANCVVRSCKNPELRYELKNLATQYGLTQMQLAEHVRECLAELTSQIVRSAHEHIGGLILCGGDVAMATAKRLNATRYQIKGTVAGCVPWGQLESQYTPFPTFTKAGGFGDPTTFSQVIQQLHKEVRQ